MDLTAENAENAKSAEMFGDGFSVPFAARFCVSYVACCAGESGGGPPHSKTLRGCWPAGIRVQHLDARHISPLATFFFLHNGTVEIGTRGRAVAPCRLLHLLYKGAGAGDGFILSHRVGFSLTLALSRTSASQANPLPEGEGEFFSWGWPSWRAGSALISSNSTSKIRVEFGGIATGVAVLAVGQFRQDGHFYSCRQTAICATPRSNRR